MATATRNRSATVVAAAGLAAVLALMVATAIVASLLGQGGCSHVKTDANGDGTAGTHDPADAIAMAARVLIEDKGAPRNAPLDGYRAAVRSYNGSGPVADAYASRVLGDAHAYTSGVTATA